MKSLSLKEGLSIIQFIIAILSLLVTLTLAYVVPFPIDLKLFGLQCILTTTMIICLIFGFSIWYYNSNYSLTRVHVRIFCVVVLWILFICLMVTGIHLHKGYAGELIFEYFEVEIFDDLDMILLKISIYTSYVIAIIMFIMNTILTIVLIRKLLRKRKKSKSSGRNK